MAKLKQMVLQILSIGSYKAIQLQLPRSSAPVNFSCSLEIFFGYGIGSPNFDVGIQTSTCQNKKVHKQTKGHKISECYCEI